MLAMLYWAEGTKGVHSCVVFANTDPKLIVLFITLFRECYPVVESKFRGRMNLHDYHNEITVRDYWSKLLKIDTEKFNKTYWKKRSENKRFRENRWGIFFLTYISVEAKDW